MSWKNNLCNFENVVKSGIHQANDNRFQKNGLNWSLHLQLPNKINLSGPTPFPKTSQVTMDLQSLIAEVADLRLQLQQLQKQKKSPCQGVTGKGTPCRNGALPGTQHCRMHSREPKAPKVPKTRKEPKPKKTIPEHTHPIDRPDPLCPLCQTHGDCMDPSLPDHQFIGEILCSPTICGETAST